MATLSVSNNQYWVRCSDGQWYENPWIYTELGSCTAVVNGDDWIVTATVWVKTTAGSDADITVYGEQVLKAWISYGNTNSDVVEMGSARYSGPTSAAFDSIKFRIKGSEASTMGFIIHVDTSSIIGTNYSKGIFWRNKGINILELYTSTTTSGLPPIYKAPTWRSLSISATTTKSITVYGAWNDNQNSGSGYKDADAVIILCDSNGKEIADSEGKSRRTIWGTSGNPSGSITFMNLPHDTNYQIKAFLTDIAGGGKTEVGWYNNATSLYTKTKKLSVVNTDIIIHQYKIISSWKSQIDDKDDITGISFYENGCIAYLPGDEERVRLGEYVYSDYSEQRDDCPNRTVTVIKLNSYTDYKMCYYVTDGYNVVGITVDAKTIYPYARIFVDGEWKKAMVYIYDGSTWKLAKGNTFDGSSFKEFNGENKE